MNQRPPKEDQVNVSVGRFLMKRQVISYLRKCLSVATDAAVLLVVTVAGYTAVLYASKVLWNLYLATSMGQQFAHYFPYAARNTADLLQHDLLNLAVWITVHCFVVCMVVGVVCRFTYVARYVHEQLGVLGRIALCGLPLTALAAMYVQYLYGFPEWGTAFMVVLVPTLFVFSPCFTYAGKLFPEAANVKSLGKENRSVP